MSIFFLLNGICFAQIPSNRTYFEFIGGIAILSGEFSGGGFPSLSFLIGNQAFITKNAFFEIQGGLALPSVITAKTGIGITTNGIGASIGLRLFPTMAYAQINFPTKNGRFHVSAEITPLENSNLSYLSFYAKNIFNFGYQWDIGKSKKIKHSNKLFYLEIIYSI